MPFYSVLIGFDTTPLKLHQSATHYITRAIIVPTMDVYYESTISFLQSTNTQGLVEVYFYTFESLNFVLLLQLYLVEYFDTQFHVKETSYFHATQPLQLHDERYFITYQHDQQQINSEVVVNQLVIQGAVRFPMIELNFADFYLPSSQYYLSNFLAVEVQTDTLKVTKYFCGRYCDMSQVIIPYSQDVLVKIVFVVKFFEIQHRFTVCNTRVIPNQALGKGVLYSVTEINPKFDLSVFSLIDNIITTISGGNDVFKDAQGISTKLSSILSPGFLNRWILLKNPKIVDINRPKFTQCPWLVESENKRFMKQLQSEFTACDYISDRVDRYYNCVISGSVLFLIETAFIPKEQDSRQLFIDLQPLHKSIAILASRVQRDCDAFGFAVASNKEIPHYQLIQEFEMGSGNLAVCNPVDKKQYLQVFHRGNQFAVIKLLMNDKKSLIASSAKGISMNLLLYEIGFDFQLMKFQVNAKQMEQAVVARNAAIDQRISSHFTLRLYVYDMIYSEEKLQSDELPTLPADVPEGEGAGPDFRASTTSFTRQSLASVNVTLAKKAVFEPQKVLSYFGGRTATFFFVQPRRPLRTFVDSLLDEQRRIKEEEQRRFEEEERLRRIQEEENARLLAEQQQREEEERAERERIYEEKQRKEEEEQKMLLEQQLLEVQSSALRFAQFQDGRKRELDELQRKMMAVKREREEKEKEEMRRKMELKKLRNLKWQQQIQRFIVDERGKIDTFYNDKMDVEERKVDEKYEVLPKVTIKTLLQSDKPYITPKFDMSPYTQQGASRLQRAKADITRIKKAQSEKAKSTAERDYFDGETSDSEIEDLIGLEQLRTKSLVISPISYTNSDKTKQKSVHRLLGRLYSSPLNVQCRK